MMTLDWSTMIEEKNNFVKDLIIANLIDIVRPSEVDRLNHEGILVSIKDLDVRAEDGTRMLRHKCNEQCKMAIRNGVYRCLKINKVKISTDSTKHALILLPNDYSIEYLEHLVKSRLVTSSDKKEEYVKTYKSCNIFFHPVCHTPPTNPTNNMNMSPIEGYICSVYMIMRNIK